jgi:hypothetical protein
MFVNGLELNEHLYRGPSKDASFQVLIHLARRFQRRRFFRNQRIRNKNGLWRPWPNGFRGEDLKKIGQSETRIACGGHVW